MAQARTYRVDQSKDRADHRTAKILLPSDHVNWKRGRAFPCRISPTAEEKYVSAGDCCFQEINQFQSRGHPGQPRIHIPLSQKRLLRRSCCLSVLDGIAFAVGRGTGRFGRTIWEIGHTTQKQNPGQVVVAEAFCGAKEVDTFAKFLVIWFRGAIVKSAINGGNEIQTISGTRWPRRVNGRHEKAPSESKFMANDCFLRSANYEPSAARISCAIFFRANLNLRWDFLINSWYGRPAPLPSKKKNGKGKPMDPAESSKGLCAKIRFAPSSCLGNAFWEKNRVGRKLFRSWN